MRTAADGCDRERKSNARLPSPTPTLNYKWEPFGMHLDHLGKDNVDESSMSKDCPSSLSRPLTLVISVNFSEASPPPCSGVDSKQSWRRNVKQPPRFFGIKEWLLAGLQLWPSQVDEFSIFVDASILQHSLFWAKQDFPCLACPGQSPGR